MIKMKQLDLNQLKQRNYDSSSNKVGMFDLSRVEPPSESTRNAHNMSYQSDTHTQEFNEIMGELKTMFQIQSESKPGQKLPL